MRRQVLAFVFAALPLAVALSVSAQAPPTPAGGLDLAALNRSAEPCTDFYEFACGGWVASNPVPADKRSWGRFQEVQDKNFAVLRRVLESKSPAKPDVAKARSYYAACMDERAIEQKGLGAIAPELSRIDALSNVSGLPALVAHLHGEDAETPPAGSNAAGTYVFFNFAGRPDFADATRNIPSIVPAGLGLPNRDYYIKTDDKSVALLRQYRTAVERLLALSGATPAHAATGAGAIVAIETALAQVSMDVAARRDPNARNHPMNVADLQALTPAFAWASYFAALKAPAFDRVNVAEPEFMKGMGQIVAGRSLDDIKAYLRFHVIHASAGMLPKAFADVDFDFFSRTLAGQQDEQPRWRRCVIQTDQHFGEALGQAFVDETFGPQAKADMLTMVQGIKAALARDIESLPWMTDVTKQAALHKLGTVVDRIGYPEKWRDYAAIRVSREDAIGNLQRARAAENARAVARIGQPVDKSEWGMTPPTVNAYYSPPANNINFPAGILQPPFYQAGRDAALNYGAAGAVIGHELTHGFDDQGRKYDEHGNLRDWWTPADGKAFEERATCIADQYSSYTVAGDTHINGRLTLGENTADNGGLRLALMAYLAGPGATPQPTIEGFTPEQRVFLGWAQGWCENARPEAERLKALTNPHSSNKYRVNGPLSNMPEFQKAFSCKADAPMVRENACRVW
jgi:putative endopeptidase